MERNKLIALIREAFKDTVYPGDDAIAHTNTQYSDYEGNTVREALKGKKWEEVGFATLSNNAIEPAFLTAEGFRYYLPAFMVCMLTDIAEVDVVGDTIVDYLTPPSDQFDDRVQGLSPEQGYSIKKFLEYLYEHYSGYYPSKEPLVAIERYWHQFDAKK